MNKLDKIKGAVGAIITAVFTVAPVLLHLFGYDTFGIFAPHLDALATLAPIGLFFGGLFVGLFLGACWSQKKIIAAQSERDERVAAVVRERDESIAAAQSERDKARTERDKAIGALEREVENARSERENFARRIGELKAENRWLGIRLSKAGDVTSDAQRRAEFEAWFAEKPAAELEWATDEDIDAMFER